MELLLWTKIQFSDFDIFLRYKGRGLSSTIRKRRNAGRVTINDVASHVGVSAITVSRFFTHPEKVSEDLRTRIASAIAELGYVPNLAAGGLASARSRIVGMVIPNISSPIFADTIQSFSDKLTRHGYQLLLASSYFSADLEENAVRAFLGWTPAAIVLTGHFHTEATEKMIQQASFPVVETWDLQADRKPIQVGFLHRDVGRDAAQYLYDKGYRRIAFVQNSGTGDYRSLDRRDGYSGVMAAHGLEPCFFVPTVLPQMEAGEQAIDALLSRQEPPDAIIFANDSLASGAILAAQRAGIKIPEQCAIFGFGDYAVGEKLLPSLTTIRPPAQEIGEVAASCILALIGVIPANAQLQHLNPLPCELIERESA
jgi:LacI family transcriptional regulator, gluconate utilization system Gnt-I transcriptional repressor